MVLTNKARNIVKLATCFSPLSGLSSGLTKTCGRKIINNCRTRKGILLDKRAIYLRMSLASQTDMSTSAPCPPVPQPAFFTEDSTGCCEVFLANRHTAYKYRTDKQNVLCVDFLLCVFISYTNLSVVGKARRENLKGLIKTRLTYSVIAYFNTYSRDFSYVNYKYSRHFRKRQSLVFILRQTNTGITSHSRSFRVF
jgi:hypothetical protein